MPRVARIVIPDQPHHVTQRGNNRQEVFASDADRRLYLSLLAEQAEAYRVRLLGYCLMNNHVHLVAVPSDEQGLAKALGRTHYRYTQYVNRTRGWSGHLWQNRFFSCVLDQPHLWKALAYVELNPVRAGLVRRAWAYAWSSAAAHVGQEAGPAWLDQRLWKDKWTGAHWREILSHEQNQVLLARIRLSTHRGRPLATERMLAKLESELGRRLRPLPVGRPRKPAADEAPAEGKGGHRRRGRFPGSALATSNC